MVRPRTRLGGAGGLRWRVARAKVALHSSPNPRDVAGLERGWGVAVGVGAARVFPVKAGRRNAGNNL